MCWCITHSIWKEKLITRTLCTKYSQLGPKWKHSTTFVPPTFSIERLKILSILNTGIPSFKENTILNVSRIFLADITHFSHHHARSFRDYAPSTVPNSVPNCLKIFKIFLLVLHIIYYGERERD